MGYVHNTSMSKFLPPTTFYGDTAAWAMAAGQVSGTIVYGCDSTDESADLYIPVTIPQNSNAQAGGLLKSVEIDFEILTAAADALACVIRKITRGADGAVAVVDDTIAFSYDDGHDDAAERIDVDQHKMTLTITTPFYVDNDEEIYVVFTIDKAATTTVEFLGAMANFTFRA